VTFIRYYVAGPMSGHADLNRPAFEKARTFIEERDPKATAIIPHEIPPIEHGDDPCPPTHTAQTTGGHGAACYLRADLLTLLESDRIYVLRGWETSVGARAEVQTAVVAGVPIEFEL
jgi:hypothetical protein